MTTKPSPRIANYVNALPLRPGIRVLEIGCGPGAAAREVMRRIGEGKVVAIDRSAKAIKLAVDGSAAELATGRLEYRKVAIEDFERERGEGQFDLAFAMRVGALDGRHPDAGRRAMRRLKAALKPEGMLFIDASAPVSGKDIDA
ncbi:class I SAM-dependent methyltransferase [Nitratireductor rhodophyticola]|uniref:SAM-dependent methyltransferase n=1 Tax=Nitratireductor rhodophyticola TaxID=2854036 RepID=UPI002AC957BB|nr:class I SAM-dependent methyltransferase [Nitratireductor rhodophyticola]MEC9246214.1 class I SAM-dependent methyltransferase [Pseudomonadota bacterium]WPZ13616.1 class I SAM-dependent methyltransferase [Nitratireductor rhodophyticola]